MVEVAGAGVDLASGEDAVLVAKDHEVAHPSGWVVGVDGVAAGHVQHGLDHDLVVADQVRILVRVAAPSFSISPTARRAGVAVDLEVGRVDRTYALIFELPGVCGSAGEDADRLDLPDAER